MRVWLAIRSGLNEARATAQQLLARLPQASLDPTNLPDELLRGRCEAFRITIA